MASSTRSISLVLLGSALFLAGCRNRDEEDNQQNGGGRPGYVPYVRTGGFIGGGRVGGGTASPSSVGPSARGGFGGTGGLSASS